MRKRTIFVSAFLMVMGLLVGLIFPSLASASVTAYPTGVTVYDPDRAWNGYTMIVNRRDVVDPKTGETTRRESAPHYLIDMNGNVVHKWKFATFERARLLPNGNTLSLFGYKGKAKTLKEYDWDSNVVWEYNAEKWGAHHDIHRLPNGNTLILGQAGIPKEYLKNIKDVDVPYYGLIPRSKMKITADVVYEITPEKEIVWIWKFWEDPWKDCQNYLIDRFNPWEPTTTHGNAIWPIPENKWYDQGDKRFKPGNILYSARALDMIYLIDKDTRKVVWSFNHSYKGGLGGQHECNMVPKGYPGEGNIIIFDNGYGADSCHHNGHSLVVEIDPVSGKIIWKYEPGLGRFYNHHRSAAYRLPNGNTLISADVDGRVMQVTRDMKSRAGGEIVWEYVMWSTYHNPDWKGARCYMIPYDYCPQFKDLPRPEKRVTPPDWQTWHLKPDNER